MSRARAALVALAIGLVVAAGGYGIAAAGGPAAADVAVGPGLVTVHVDIHYSRFVLDHRAVRVGTLVRFVVRNHDPINHELVVGDASIHAAHQRGTEATHPPVPGEVSVGPHDTGVTTYRFDRAGSIEYACHLPGHLAYGMIGEITVVG